MQHFGRLGAGNETAGFDGIITINERDQFAGLRPPILVDIAATVHLLCCGV